VTNLLENAITYASGGGPIEVDVERRGDLLEISVSDRGPGLGDQDPERLFERYYPGRADKAGREVKGAGLGLAICKAIVEAHGGTIAAADRTGGGATFRFTLPVSRDAPSVPGEPGATPSA
jgi:two-component system sensor histidine kinase KdpD